MFVLVIVLPCVYEMCKCTYGNTITRMNIFTIQLQFHLRHSVMDNQLWNTTEGFQHRSPIMGYLSGIPERRHLKSLHRFQVHRLGVYLIRDTDSGFKSEILDVTVFALVITFSKVTIFHSNWWLFIINPTASSN